MNNNNVNPTELLRPLIVYAVCVIMAVIAGYALVNGLNYGDFQSVGTIGLVVGVLIFPLLMKWHYPLLVLSCGLPATLFFLPGHPTLFVAMVAASLTISVVERILNRDQPFLPATGVRWPLLAFLLVVLITAKMTGGFGMRSMGSDVYGGRKYVMLIAGILSFFAFTARPIPKKYANLYVGLYFGGAVFNIVSDLYPYVPSVFRFIYLVFPASGQFMGTFDNQWDLGVTRLSGVSTAGIAIIFWMLARHGIRENILTSKLWRPALLALAAMLVLTGGFRSSVIGVLIVLALLFYMEKMHQTGVMLVLILVGLMSAVLVVPLASHLPHTFQRSLAFLPLDISPEVRMDAEGSTTWRVEMWKALLPQIPQYLLLGKGYAFSAETFNESMGVNAMFQHNIDASQDPLALSSDFHSGPLSILIPFGIWGALVWLWYWLAGFWVVWRNFRYGDQDLRHINVFFLALFISKCVTFLFVFGGLVEDMGSFAALIGLSVAINHGVMQPAPAVQPAPASPVMPFPGAPAWQR